MRSIPSDFVPCRAINKIDMNSLVLLDAIYDTGNKIGPVLALVTCLVIVAELAYVMAKYVFAKSE